MVQIGIEIEKEAFRPRKFLKPNKEREKNRGLLARKKSREVDQRGGASGYPEHGSDKGSESVQNNDEQSVV